MSSFIVFVLGSNEPAAFFPSTFKFSTSLTFVVPIFLIIPAAMSDTGILEAVNFKALNAPTRSPCSNAFTTSGCSFVSACSTTSSRSENSNGALESVIGAGSSVFRASYNCLFCCSIDTSFFRLSKLPASVTLVSFFLSAASMSSLLSCFFPASFVWSLITLSKASLVS